MSEKSNRSRARQLVVTKPNAFHAAVVEMFGLLAPEWFDWNEQNLTHIRERALTRLTEAGYAQRCADLTMRMDGFPERLTVRVWVSGDYVQKLKDCVAQVIGLVPDWLDEQGRNRQWIRFEWRFLRARLTGDGVAAKAMIYDRDWQAWMLLFICGIFDGARGHVAAGDLRIFQTRVRSEESSTSANTNVSAAAQAIAQVGDIHVHNAIRIDATGLRSAESDGSQSTDLPPRDTSAVRYDDPKDFLSMKDIRQRYEDQLSEKQFDALEKRLRYYHKRPGSRAGFDSVPGKQKLERRWPANVVHRFVTEIREKRTK